jgi:predicted transcriptional regulator
VDRAAAYTPLVMPRKPQRRLTLSGDLQIEVMAHVWDLGEATVDDVRARQRRSTRSAYTTIQTVMNRLVDRGLLSRQRKGRAFVYKPRYQEPEFIAQVIRDRLDEASPDARRAALVSLVGQLAPDDVDEIARHANRIKRARGKG